MDLIDDDDRIRQHNALRYRQYLFAEDLEALTGIPQSTWRFWASVKKGPPSHRLGRRRVWPRTGVEQWLTEQQTASA
jgi:prophage regulatory protein